MMEDLKFKTNLKCGGCVAAVKNKLDALAGVKSWEVDLASVDKIMTINGEVAAESVENAFESAGYQAEKIS